MKIQKSIRFATMTITILLIALWSTAISANSSFNEAILKQHNFYRNIAGIKSLKWNKDLEALSSSWASTLKKSHDCKLQHSSKSYRSNATSFRYVGENLYGAWSSRAFTVGPEQGLKAVDNWYNEIRDFQYSKKGVVCAKRNQKQAIGHFTQVMWDKSTDVGCAYATCGAGTSMVVVCNYGPAGNFNQRTNPPFNEEAARRLNEHPVNKNFGGLPRCD